MPARSAESISPLRFPPTVCQSTIRKILSQHQGYLSQDLNLCSHGAQVDCKAIASPIHPSSYITGQDFSPQLEKQNNHNNFLATVSAPFKKNTFQTCAFFCCGNYFILVLYSVPALGYLKSSLVKKKTMFSCISFKILRSTTSVDCS